MTPMIHMSTLVIFFVLTILFMFFLAAFIRLFFVIWFAIVHPHEILEESGRDWFDEEGYEQHDPDPFYYEPLKIEIIDREEAFE